MERGVHFISGLPRSGSTLLAALLNQNPAFAAGMTSPVGTLTGRVQEALGPRGDYAAEVSDTQRSDVLRGIFDGFYKEVHHRKTVFDTHRVWCSRLPLLAALFPAAKVVVCVRDLAWIMDSFERVHRENPLSVSRMFRPGQGATAHARVAALTSPAGVVGFAWDATQEAFYGTLGDRLIVVDYEALAREPQRALAAIYARLGLPPFEHDVEHVAFDKGRAFDDALGVPGLHRVSKRVRYAERDTILPPDLFARLSGRSYWRDPDKNPRGVEVLLPGA